MATTQKPPTPNSAQADIYGRRPDPVAMPTPYQDLESIYPALGGSTGELSSNILSQLRGELSPGARNNIVNDAATFGVKNGLIGSEFGGYAGTNRMATAREGQVQRGIGNLLQALPTIQRVGTVDPALQTQIRTQNNVWDSAPDPAAATRNALGLYQGQLNQHASSFQAPSRGSSGGGGSMFNPSPTAGGGYAAPQTFHGTGSGQGVSPSMFGGGSDQYNWVTDPQYDWLFDSASYDTGGGQGGGVNQSDYMDSLQNAPGYYQDLGNVWMDQNPDFNPADWK